MKLDDKAILAAIAEVARCRELRLSDTTTARNIVKAYLEATKGDGDE